MLKQIYVLVLSLPLSLYTYAQSGTLSGDLQTNVNIFQRDSSIGAYNTPLYDNYFTGIESWLNVNYSIAGFTAGVRVDAYLNSNLIDPNKAYTGVGLGYYYLEKDIGDLTIRSSARAWRYCYPPRRWRANQGRTPERTRESRPWSEERMQRSTSRSRWPAR